MQLCRSFGCCVVSIQAPIRAAVGNAKSQRTYQIGIEIVEALLSLPVFETFAAAADYGAHAGNAAACRIHSLNCDSSSWSSSQMSR